MLNDRSECERAEDGLFESEALFRQVWEITADAMALSNAEGIVLAANPAYLSLYGYTPEQVIGQSFAIIFPEEVREWAIEQYKIVFNSESSPASFESVIRRADGMERIVESSATFLTVDGQRTAMLSTIRDITARRQAEETAAYLATIVQASADPIIGLSLDGLIRSWNPAAERLLGYSAAEAIGQPIAMITIPERHREQQKILSRLRAGEVIHIESVGITKAGKHVDVLVNAAPVVDMTGHLIGISVTLTDITLHKQAQSAEMHHRLVLSQEEERSHLARELHDGPLQELTALSFELAMLRQEPGREQQQSYMTAMEERLAQTSRHLRQIAVTLRPPILDFGLVPAIRQCIEGHCQKQPAQTVEAILEPEIPALPEATTLALYRICSQSLSNVAQHAAATHVWVRLHVTSTQLVLEIEDDGRGFAVPDNWTEFARQHHLGVAGMAERAHAIGGLLVVHSAPGQGTRVRVTVPLPQP
jgi:PAS domain S-box-containing protein